MQKYWLYLCIFWLPICLYSHPHPPSSSIQLIDILKTNSATGDWLVYEQGQLLFLFIVKTKSAETITLEEVAISKSRFSSLHFPWHTWYEKKAPFHTSWKEYLLSLQTGKLLSIFSISHGRYEDISHQENFLPTLLHIPFDIQSTNAHEWMPPVYFEGKKRSDISLQKWEGVWPTDNTIFSKKKLLIYLPDSKTCLLHYFPYWISVEKMHPSFHIRIVDSGHFFYNAQK